MDTLHIPLDDWEHAALTKMARARGLDPATLARRLLDEGIGLQCRPLTNVPAAPEAAPDEGRPGDRIEVRLLRLFDE